MPAPPASVPVPPPLDASTPALVDEALAARAELSADRARIEAARARISLADRLYWPGFGLMATYNTMWRMPEHQVMIGASIELPVWQGRRDARLDQAHAEHDRARRMLEAKVDEIATEVAQAQARYVEAIEGADLYGRRVVPLAEQLARAALSGYASGANDFASVLQAQRAWRDAQLTHHTLLAQAHQARARLARSLGRSPLRDQAPWPAGAAPRGSPPRAPRAD